MTETRYLASSVAVLLAFLLASTTPAGAQGQDCGEGQPALNPGRPSVSNAATTTACGHLETDHGFTRQMNSDDSASGTLNATFRYGVTRRMDLQWSFDELTRTEVGGGTVRGVGDNWFSARYRFIDQSRFLPAFGLRYSVKAPTAPLKIGGSGFVDHQLSALVSRDVRKLHFDFNLIETFYGTPSGFTHGSVSALAATGPVTSRIAWLTEAYGGRQADNSLFASQYLGTLISVNTRLALDIGMDMGLTSAAPKQRLLFGFSYSIGQLRPTTQRAAAIRPLN